jgi:hypothetical protein
VTGVDSDAAREDCDHDSHDPEEENFKLARRRHSSACAEHSIQRKRKPSVRKKVVVMRNTWDRACWIDMQSMIARIFGQIADLPTTARDDEVRVHYSSAQAKAPGLARRGGFRPQSVGTLGGWGSRTQTRTMRVAAHGSDRDIIISGAHVDIVS